MANSTPLRIDLTIEADRIKSQIGTIGTSIKSMFDAIGKNSSLMNALKPGDVGKIKAFWKDTLNTLNKDIDKAVSQMADLTKGTGDVTERLIAMGKVTSLLTL